MSEDIPTLYQLCRRHITLRYGLTIYSIQDLIVEPDTRVPPHHQVDPRAIEAYLIDFEVPTWYINGQGYPLISRRYRENYRYWLAAVESNNQSIQQHIQGTYTESDHLRLVRAALDRWRDGYLRTYHYFDDILLRDIYHRYPLPGSEQDTLCSSIGPLIYDTH